MPRPEGRNPGQQERPDSPRAETIGCTAGGSLIDPRRARDGFERL